MRVHISILNCKYIGGVCIITLQYNVVAEMVFVNKFKKKLWVCMFVCMYTSL